MSDEVIALVPAAGLGLRFFKGAGLSSAYPAAKQYAMLDGRPIIVWALEALERSALVSAIIPVCKAGDESIVLSLALEHGIGKVQRVVTGGVERQDSVLNGLRAIDGFRGIVIVHDGVRPLLTDEIIRRTIEGLDGADGAAASVTPKDTIKETGPDGMVMRTPARDMLRAVQTPQAFRYETARRAYENAERDGFRATDDAALVERYGGSVRLTEGAYTNIKITTPEDLLLAQALVREGEWRAQA